MADIAPQIVHYIELIGCVHETGEKHKTVASGTDSTVFQYRILTEKMENNNNDSSGDSKSDSIRKANVDDAVFDVFKAPVCEGDKEPIVKNLELLESSMDRLINEKEAFYSKRQYPLVNTRALPKEATTYKLETFDKHALVIFNQEKIDGLPRRVGTEKDVESLTRTFKNFDFEVTIHNDLTRDAFFRELNKFSQKDFTDYGCLAVAILTHGTDNGMMWAKDQVYGENEVINHFKGYSNFTLVTKPKIFIMQACRDSVDSGVVQPSGKICGADLKEPYYILPMESDLLILHSTYPGSPSFRNDLYGTWFIQTLCEKMDTLSLTQDLESIITEVKRDVAIDKQFEMYDWKTHEMKVMKQMPVMTSTLIRKLYLKKFVKRALEETYVDKSKQRNESRHEVLDGVSSSTMTPLFDPFGSSRCFLEYFTYMRNCLRYFVAENPNDETAQDILDIANTYEDSVKFNKSKDKMCKVIINHLMDKAQNNQIYKYYI